MGDYVIVLVYQLGEEQMDDNVINIQPKETDAFTEKVEATIKQLDELYAPFIK